jgi:hypothetical protein
MNLKEIIFGTVLVEETIIIRGGRGLRVGPRDRKGLEYAMTLPEGDPVREAILKNCEMNK